MVQNLKVLAAMVCLFGLVACGSTPITTNVTPSLMTIARAETNVINPLGCNDWLSPSWKEPQDWWNSLRINQPPNAVGQVAVGFDQLFDTNSNPTRPCTKARQNLYRGGMTYDLSQQQNLKGHVINAELTYWSFILPSGVTATGACPQVIGGGGPLLLLQPGAAMPAAINRFASLGAAPYPATGTVFNMPVPWHAATFPGVQPGVNVTTLATGQGGASFTADVTTYLNGALNQGAMSMNFMLGGIDETPLTVPPPGPIDCKTVYKVGDLVIKHL
jgi:hypothetical protein